MDPTAERGIVFNLQRFSLDDGEGIRTCVFLKGCPLRCRWCHNAESQSFTREIMFYPENCIRCGACADVCPAGAHILTASGHTYDRAKCLLCGACADVCPTVSLEQVGQTMTADDVMRKVLRDRPFYGKNGGITLTGGEPMAQFPFTLALAIRARAEGLNTVMETSGFAQPEQFRQIAPYIDCFYYDCKADSERHKELTGADDTRILENLRLLGSLGANIVLRCPIIPGGNLTDGFLEKIIRIADTVPLLGVTLLPYHKIGAQKAAHLGMAPQEEFSVPDRREMDVLRNTIRAKTRIPVK